MKPLLSLIKVSLNHDMNIFKINSKKQSKLSKILLPIILTGYIMGIFGVYSNELIPTTGIFLISANAFAVAIPILIPVNDPRTNPT